MQLKIKFIKDDDEGILTYCEEEDAEKFYFQQILTARFSWGSNSVGQAEGSMYEPAVRRAAPSHYLFRGGSASHRSPLRQREYIPFGIPMCGCAAFQLFFISGLFADISAVTIPPPFPPFSTVSRPPSFRHSSQHMYSPSPKWFLSLSLSSSR